MPRGKRLTDAQKVAAILEKFAIQTDEPLVIPEADYNHNNAVAMFAKVPEHFVQGKCMECEELFAHNQPIPAGTRVGYCSDACRKKAFKKSTGIEWGAVVSNREPWDGDPPMIITPEQLKNLEKIADWFSRNRTTLEIVDPEPSEQPEPSQELDSPLENQSPTSQEPSLLLPDFDFDDQSIFESENQYPATSQTNPQNRHAVEEPVRMFEEDVVFDFE